MLTLISLHIIFVVSWYAGLFYLPRLFVYHSMTRDPAVSEQLKVMERRLDYFTAIPAVLTIVTGLWLWFGYGITGGWMHVKAVLVALLIAHHLWLGKLRRDFAADRNTHGDKFYRWINEIPALPILVIIVFLVVMKPF